MNNISLNYTVLGQGEPLIIIHGLFGSSRNWKTLAKSFAETFQVILLDLRNHGDSPFDSEMDFPVMVQDVLGLMQQLDIQSAHILGHSMGGKVAMMLAQQNPDKVLKLVIADIAPMAYQHDYDEILDAALKLDLSGISNRREADQLLEKGIKDQRVRQFILQSLVLQQGVASWKINWQAIKNNMRSIIGYVDIDNWQVNNPSLFIRGEFSNYVNDAGLELIQHHFLNTEVVTLKNAGHWLHAEQPANFYQAVYHFLLK